MSQRVLEEEDGEVEEVFEAPEGAGEETVPMPATVRVRYGTRGGWDDVPLELGETAIEAGLRALKARSTVRSTDAGSEGEDPLVQARGGSWYLILC